MRRLLLISAFLLCASEAYAACGGSSPNLVPASNALTDVQDCVTAAVAGDTITLASGTTAWAGTLTINKLITVIGNGCTVDADDRPTACNTIIQDSTTGTLVQISLPACSACGNHARLAYIEFVDNGRGGTGIPFNVSGPLDVDSTAPMDDSRARIDHVYFNDLNGSGQAVVQVARAYGVADHNTLITNNGNTMFFHLFNTTAYKWADTRWSEDLDAGAGRSPTGWGTDKFWFIESNYFECTMCSGYVTDGDSGHRWVVRFNDSLNVTYATHGTDTSTRARGVRAIESYLNNIDNPATGSPQDMRSGPLLAWGNTVVNTASIGAYSLGAYGTQQYRADGINEANGTSVVDVNDTANNPYDSCTVTDFTGTNPFVIECSAESWTPDQWIGFSAYRSSPACITNHATGALCGLLITDNDATTLTVAANGNFTLNISVGQTVQINKVLHVLDQACRSGGTIGTIVDIGFGSLTRFDASTAEATWTHGLMTGDVILATGHNPNQYRGEFVVTVIDSDTLRYTLAADPTTDATFEGEMTPLAWTPGTNDQVTDPCYEWLNTDDGVDADMDPNAYPLQIRENEHYFKYEPALTFDGTIAANRSSVGVGDIANRPSTCTTGVAYWAQDEAEWDSTSAGDDGQLYVCTATNTWTLYYTPYTYPHPLVSNDPVITLVDPSSGDQGAANLAIDITGANTAWMNGTTAATFSGTGITVDSTTCASTTACTVTIDIAADATANSRTLTMTTGAAMETSSFTVNAVGGGAAGSGGGGLGRTRTRTR